MMMHCMFHRDRKIDRGYTHLSCGARRSRFLHDACHRGTSPPRAHTAPVFRLAFAAGREDGRPERVLESEGGRGERCAAWHL